MRICMSVRRMTELEILTAGDHSDGTRVSDVGGRVRRKPIRKSMHVWMEDRERRRECLPRARAPGDAERRKEATERPHLYYGDASNTDVEISLFQS